MICRVCGNNIDNTKDLEIHWWLSLDICSKTCLGKILPQSRTDITNFLATLVRSGRDTTIEKFFTIPTDVRDKWVCEWSIQIQSLVAQITTKISDYHLEDNIDDKVVYMITHPETKLAIAFVFYDTLCYDLTACLKFIETNYNIDPTKIKILPAPDKMNKKWISKLDN